MMIPLAAACLGLGLLSPAAAQVPQAAAPAQPAAAAAAAPERMPALAPGQWLLDAFGPAGLQALQARGYVIVQGQAPALRLQQVQWKSLEAISRNTKAVQEFSEAWAKLQKGQALGPAGPLPFLALGDLPETGLMTPPLHALLEAMAAYHEAMAALAGPKDAAAAVPTTPATALNLFDTAWGKAFARRTHADIIYEPRPMIKPLFDSLLAGVQNQPGAASHFTSYIQDRYQVDISSRLASDAGSGLASEELRLWLGRYLTDQRRLHAVARIRRQAADLEKRTSLTRDLASLAAVASVFRSQPGLLSELEGAVQAAAGAAPPAFSGAQPVCELTSAGLHLQKPAHLGQHELGDAVVVSGAYWVDGLAEGRTLAIEETTFREKPEGLRDVQTHTVKRGNGGPYPFARRMVLEDSSPFTFRSLISGPSGNTLNDSVAVPVAKDFELALLQLGAADNQALSCSFQEAAAAYANIETSVTEAAREKPQYQGILETARKRRIEAANDAAQLAQIEEAITGTMPDSSPEQCRYDLKRTEAALALAKSLPAGCDSYLADLHKQRQIIARRAADQQAFAAISTLAASHRRACNFGLAAEAWSRALAILDADPAARCGPTAQAAVQAEADLLAVRADELWRAAAAEAIHLAEAEALPAERLRILNGLIARIGTLSNPSCLAPERDLAERLARSAGEALVLPDALAAKLSTDEGISGAVEEVAAQRRKLMDEAAVLQTKKAAEQAPVGMGTPPPEGRPEVAASSAPLKAEAAAPGEPPPSPAPPPVGSPQAKKDKAKTAKGDHR